MIQEGTIIKPNEIDADFRERLETLKRYANAEIEKCDELIQEREKEVDEYKYLRKKVAEFPKVLRREEWLPINDYAFIRGTYDNTNKFYTLLGSQYFAERSSIETVEFIERQIKAINDIKEGYEKQKELAKSRLEFAENLFDQQNSDVVEIREPYDIEKLKVKLPPKEDVSNADFGAIMSRLNELEKEEENENIETHDNIKDESTANIKPEQKNKESKGVAPKGVSQEDFEKLIKQVDEMIESSSDDEEDYEDEDMSEEVEDFLDSDDSLPDSGNRSVTQKEAQLVTSPPKSTVSTTKKSIVRFAEDLEAGPTVGPVSSTTPKSILRNKDVKTPVDEAAVKAMDEVVPERKILPATDAFKGVFIERNPHTLEPSTSAVASDETKKPLSKFKAKRMNL